MMQMQTLLRAVQSSKSEVDEDTNDRGRQQAVQPGYPHK